MKESASAAVVLALAMLRSQRRADATNSNTAEWPVPQLSANTESRCRKCQWRGRPNRPAGSIRRPGLARDTRHNAIPEDLGGDSGRAGASGEPVPSRGACAPVRLNLEGVLCGESFSSFRRCAPLCHRHAMRAAVLLGKEQIRVEDVAPPPAESGRGADSDRGRPDLRHRPEGLQARLPRQDDHPARRSLGTSLRASSLSWRRT